MPKTQQQAAPDSRYAQVLAGLIVNVIVLDDPSLIPLFAQGFDSFVQVDQLLPEPGIGWSYDGVSKFTPPLVDPTAPLLNTLVNKAGGILNQKTEVLAVTAQQAQQLVQEAEQLTGTVGDPDVDQALNNIVANKSF